MLLHLQLLSWGTTSCRCAGAWVVLFVLSWGRAGWLALSSVWPHRQPLVWALPGVSSTGSGQASPD